MNIKINQYDDTEMDYTLTSEPALFAGRGFTAHEFLPDFNLYNMNGRLYDPVVGRFLSPDPYIQDAGFTQGYNRYSYVLNNSSPSFATRGKLFVDCIDILQKNKNTVFLRQKCPRTTTS